MDFAEVFHFLLENFKREGIDFALMGGMALQSSGIVRTTRDIDLLILRENAPRVKDIMNSRQYTLLHESEDILNFYHDDIRWGRVDFLLAHRKYALRMLQNAQEKDIFDERFTVKILRTEDLIGLKLQSMVNDSKRAYQDMADIKALIDLHKGTLNMHLIKEYFSLFKKEEMLDNILKDTHHA